MRKSRLSAGEVAELDAFNRSETRKSGFDLIPMRDRGYADLKKGGRVHWHFKPREREPYYFPDSTKVTTYSLPCVADGEFGVEVGGKLVVFDSEELMKHLRWA